MNEQYFHQQSNVLAGRYTVYLEVPDRSDLHRISSLPNPIYTPEREIKIKVGIAKLHPKDQYNKSIGRKVAKEKATVETFKLLNVSYLQESVEILLSSAKIDIILKVNPNYKKVHFIHAAIV